MRKLVQCPKCGAILLKDVDRDVLYWQELNCFELSALITILESKPLLVLTGEIKLVDNYYCKRCDEHYNLN